MIGFFCPEHLPNYEEEPEAYKYLPGKVSSTAYYFWILKNHNVDNIKLVKDRKDVDSCTAIVFHYDDRDKIATYKGKKIQVVTDRPPVSNADLYICCNEFVTNPKFDLNLINQYGMLNMDYTFTKGKNWKYIHYPPTYGVKKCTPAWPPTNFRFVGRKHTLIPDFKCNDKKRQIEDLGINLEFDYENDANNGTEHVYFCVRDLSLISSVTGQNNIAGKAGARTPNRAYQAWYMNVPGIFNLSPEMYYLRKDDNDFLIANDFHQFYEACKRLRTDEQLYWSMVERAKERCSNNHYEDLSIVKDQWLEALQSI